MTLPVEVWQSIIEPSQRCARRLQHFMARIASHAVVPEFAPCNQQCANRVEPNG